MEVRNTLAAWISIFILSLSALQAGQIVKITLHSSEVIARGRLDSLSKDSVVLTLLSDEMKELRIDVNDIMSLISLQESAPTKYIFSDLSEKQRTDILNRLIAPTFTTDLIEPTAPKDINAQRRNLLIALAVSSILVILAITLLLKHKRKPDKQAGIPGVEAMAKTTFFWAEWHRQKNEAD